MTEDTAVVAQAEAVAELTIRDLVSRLGSDNAVVLKAPAGAGKSHFVCTAVGHLREKRARVAVCAPTNEQLYSLVERLAVRYPRETLTVTLGQGRVLPPAAQRNNVRQVEAADTHGSALLLGTIDKLADAYARGKLDRYDVLVMDESFQADAGRYYGVGAVAATHLLVGDSGQLSPFSTIDDPDRWRGLEEDPLQTAIGVLLRNHPSTVVHPFPISRRLDPRAIEIAQSFYPGLEFKAALRPGVRELRLAPAPSHGGLDPAFDEALDYAAVFGWAHLELPEAAVLTADPATIEAIVNVARRLLERTPVLRSELHTDFRPLVPSRIAIGVSHNDQKDYLRVALQSAGLGDVVVETANKLQGLEFEVVIVWHPLAGLPEPDGFHLDPGRLCVLLTRHRQACIVVGRASDRALVEGLPPPTPAYLGWAPDPVLDGWSVHHAVFTGLEDFRVVAGHAAATAPWAGTRARVTATPAGAGVGVLIRHSREAPRTTVAEAARSLGRERPLTAPNDAPPERQGTVPSAGSAGPERPPTDRIVLAPDVVKRLPEGFEWTYRPDGAAVLTYRRTGRHSAMLVGTVTRDRRVSLRSVSADATLAGDPELAKARGWLMGQLARVAARPHLEQGAAFHGALAGATVFMRGGR